MLLTHVRVVNQALPGMRREGWLGVAVDKAPPAHQYVIIEGYILRIFAEEPTLPDAPANVIMDLRYVETLSPEDVYSPSGPCVLVTKASSKPVILQPTTIISSEKDNWWMPIIASAVPDHAVAQTLRARFRSNDLVLALMSEHATQTSAFKVSDKLWRKKSSKELRAAPKPAAKASAGPKSDVASLLAKAQKNRAAQFANEQVGTDDGAQAVEIPKTTPTPGAHLEAEAEAISEPRSLASSSAPMAAVVDAMDNTGANRDGTAGGASPASSTSRAPTTAAPRSWWFIRDSDGNVTGPHSDAEMRRRYLCGKVKDSTVVRFLPYSEKPAPDEHEGMPFGELRELCSAAGPPFLE